MSEFDEFSCDEQKNLEITSHSADEKKHKPKTKNFKKTAARLKADGVKGVGHRPSLDWHLSSEQLCAKVREEPVLAPLEELKAMIAATKTGYSLFQSKGFQNLRIQYDAQTEIAQFYPKDNMIVLSPNRPMGEILNILSRKMRRAWQYHQGLLISPLYFEPDAAVLINRAQTADTLMISIRIAWEMKMSGNSIAWDYLIGSPLGDVGRVYELKARDFRTLNNGEAVRSAYDQWLLGNRTKLIDKAIIQDMLLDDTGYMKDVKRDRKVTLDLIAQYGDMPYTANYMNVKGYKSPMDRDYGSVEDRSNANFLWFIKFERSFLEREKKMIEESIKKSAEIVDFARAVKARKIFEETVTLNA
jgi:hypothetical protein